ncbi:hypothetical protein BY996DRAFT_6429864 [Phakopsora pachyrhizi]|nr:hypothetical protein BY996DRAFT_6429864 [Phakopsora pachyrhizi]
MELACKTQINPTFIIYLIPAFLQCSFLYLSLLASSSSLKLKSKAFSLLILNIYLIYKASNEICFKPIQSYGFVNLGLVCVLSHLFTKTVEWALLDCSMIFLKNSDRDHHHESLKQIIASFDRRPEFDSVDIDSDVKKNEDTAHKRTDDNLETKNNEENGEKSWDDNKNGENVEFSFREWYVWTAEQFSSPRGIQYQWGPRVTLKPQTAKQLIKRLYKINLINICSTVLSIYFRENKTAKDALIRLGLPNVPILTTIIAEAMRTLSFGVFLITITDIAYSTNTLFAHLIHFINDNDSVNLKFPSWFLRYFNMRTYVPIYDSPHLSTSLAHLWGKAWHQIFRRAFLVFGALPASELAKRFGLSKNFQRLAGLWGCFLASGILHETAIRLISRKPHPQPYRFSEEFPGSFFYFMVQPIGIIIEPFVIPYVPGGGLVWTYFFTLLTATPFRNQYFKDFRLLDYAYPDISLCWLIPSLLLPGSAVWGIRMCKF